MESNLDQREIEITFFSVCLLLKHGATLKYASQVDILYIKLFSDIEHFMTKLQFVNVNFWNPYVVDL